MKKILVFLVLVVLAVTVKAQTTMLAFQSVSQEIKIAMPELFDGQYGLITSGPTYIRVDDSKIVAGKEYLIEISYPGCSYVHKTRMTIAKNNKIGDFQTPCYNGKLVKKECQCAQDSTWAEITNLSAKEFKVLTPGVFSGLTLGGGQSAKQVIPLGDLNITLGFRDTVNYRLLSQAVISRFILKDTSCIFKIEIKDAELDASSTSAGAADFSKKAKTKETIAILPENTSRKKVTITDGDFKGVSLAPHSRSAKKYRQNITPGFIPLTVEFLNDNNVRVRMNIYVHITPGDCYLTITDESLGLKPDSNPMKVPLRRR